MVTYYTCARATLPVCLHWGCFMRFLVYDHSISSNKSMAIYANKCPGHCNSFNLLKKPKDKKIKHAILKGRGRSDTLCMDAASLLYIPIKYKHNVDLPNRHGYPANIRIYWRKLSLVPTQRHNANKSRGQLQHNNPNITNTNKMIPPKPQVHIMSSVQ